MKYLNVIISKLVGFLGKVTKKWSGPTDHFYVNVKFLSTKFSKYVCVRFN